MTPDQFKSIRTSLSLTQAEAARLIGAGLSLTVTRYENGSRVIPDHAARLMLLMRDVSGAAEYLNKLPCHKRAASKKSMQPGDRARRLLAEDKALREQAFAMTPRERDIRALVSNQTSSRKVESRQMWANNSDEQLADELLKRVRAEPMRDGKPATRAEVIAAYAACRASFELNERTAAEQELFTDDDWAVWHS
jgi:transcriptional regulator with XRE-family HTH domain